MPHAGNYDPAIPRSSPREYEQGRPALLQLRGPTQPKHTVNFSMTTRKKCSFLVVMEKLTLCFGCMTTKKCAYKLSTGMKRKQPNKCRMHEISCSKTGGYQMAPSSTKGLMCCFPLASSPLCAENVTQGTHLQPEKPSRGHLCTTCWPSSGPVAAFQSSAFVLQNSKTNRLSSYLAFSQERGRRN